MKRNLMLIIALLLFGLKLAMADQRFHNEKYYQERFCTGETEYSLVDGSRIDCLQGDYAIEIDFANKWTEGIGQSLYYAFMTNKKPGLALIVEKPEDMRFVVRAWLVASGVSPNIYMWIIEQ